MAEYKPVEWFLAKKSLLPKLPKLTEVPGNEVKDYDYIVRGKGSLFDGYYERTIFKIKRAYNSIIVLERAGRESYVIPSTEWYLAKEGQLNEDTVEEPPEWLFQREL